MLTNAISYLTAVAVFSTEIKAQTPQQKDEYPEYAAGMDKYGYTWEPIKITTEDGYILTTFHITGKKGTSLTSYED